MCDYDVLWPVIDNLHAMIVNNLQFYVLHDDNHEQTTPREQLFKLRFRATSLEFLQLQLRTLHEVPLKW